MKKSIITDTDFYKNVHWKALKPGVTGMEEYGEPRKGARYPSLLWFGLSMIIQDHFLQVPTMADIQKAEDRIIRRGGNFKMFNREVWEKVHKLGYLPIRIKAAPEGSLIPVNNAFYKFEATESWFAGTLGVLEDTMLHTWYPTEIASRAFYIMQNIKPAFITSSDVMKEILPIAVNDFAYRGSTCHEAAARGGAGFMSVFMGSDNQAAADAIEDYYDYLDRLKSVWATEHSVALSFGKGDELGYLKHQLLSSDPNQIVANVIDAYDQDNYIREIACHPEIVEIIKNRPGRVVFRPDTGDALTNMVKYSDILSTTYGFGINSKGYKVLKENVGLIQGDGMDEYTIPQLYNNYIKTHWAADNIITGSGGGLLQVDVSRDNQRWAIKPCHMIIDGVDTPVQKTPKSDPSKNSKLGHVKLSPSMHSYTTYESGKMSKETYEGYVDAFETVLENGQFKRTNFADILRRVEANI